MEHGRWGHFFELYEETVRVPLILSLPGVVPEGRRIGTDVQLCDVAPTLLDLLGFETPAGMQGRSLLPTLYATPPASETPVATHMKVTMNRDAVSAREVEDGPAPGPGQRAARTL